MKNILRERLRPMLGKYLDAQHIKRFDSAVVCPRCKDLALLEPDDSWRCVRCGARGDTLDYARALYPQLGELELIRGLYRQLGLRLPELRTVEAEELLDMEFREGGYLVERLLGPGLYLLAGASKIGKSWLVLHLADCVSRGAPIWGLKTAGCEVLYLSLEDTQRRLQQRLSEVCEGALGKLHLATEASLLGKGFEEQLSAFLAEHPDVGLVIIDTLQRLRQVRAEQYSYAGDYEAMTALKNIADAHGITILMVHHTRKQEAGDSFNLISGTTGLMGCADGALLLQKRQRRSPEATLDVTGRETPDLQLKLRFNDQTKHWDFLGFGQGETPQPDRLLEAVRALTEERGYWEGTATQLLELLQPRLSRKLVPQSLARRLNASAVRLEQDYGVIYETSRNNAERLIHLSPADPPAAVTEVYASGRYFDI